MHPTNSIFNPSNNNNHNNTNPNPRQYICNKNTNVNYTTAAIPPLPPFPSSQPFNNPSIMAPHRNPPIPLPPLTTTHIHSTPTCTPPIIASVSLNNSQTNSPQIKSARKRNATQMMAETVHDNIHITTKRKQSKRQKIQRNKNSKSTYNRRCGTQSAKFKSALEKLKIFAVEHNHKLPSLRYIMKMLKVGFPKAHEIIDEYAKSIGKTKEQVIQDMTVRQENERKTTYKKGNKARRVRTRTKSSKVKHEKANGKDEDTDSTNSSVFSSNTPVIPMIPIIQPIHAHCNNNNKNNMNSVNSVNQNKIIVNNHSKIINKNVNVNVQAPANFSMNLSQLLSRVTNDEKWQVFEREYLCNVSKLESFINGYDEYILTTCALEDKVKYGIACYTISEAYYSRGWRKRKDIALTFFEKSLKIFKQCNKDAMEWRNREYDGDNNNNNEPWEHQYNNNMCGAGDGLIGYFWKEIVGVLILGGQILLDDDRFLESQKYYDLAYNIVNNIQTNGADVESKNDYLYQCLQDLSIVHCYQKNYTLCCKYGREFLHQMINASDSENMRDVRNIIEIKAWLSCNLMYCTDQKDREQGYNYYASVLHEAENKIGMQCVFTYEWYCYFAIHFIRNCKWHEAHGLMYKILRITGDISDKCVEDINAVFTDYCEIINNLSAQHKCMFIVKYKAQIMDIMSKLHLQQIAYVNNVNKKSMIKQNEYKEKNKKDLVDENNEDMDMILNDRFNYNIENEYEYLYPKINIIKVVISHVRLLYAIGNQQFGYHILNNLVNKDTKCLNQNSQYFDHYPFHKVQKNEIHTLLNLL